MRAEARTRFGSAAVSELMGYPLALLARFPLLSLSLSRHGLGIIARLTSLGLVRLDIMSVPDWRAYGLLGSALWSAPARTRV